MEPWYHIDKSLAFWPVTLWFRWHFEDLERIPTSGPAILACNHASYLDPWANAYAVIKSGRRPRFLAKEELFKIPIVGTALLGGGQIPVRRGSGDRTSLLRAEQAIAAGEVVLIYPEGTVTKRPDHLPMDGKNGTVRLSLATGVPIIPLASWGSHAVWQKSGKGSLRFGRPVWVKVGAPLDFSSRRDQAGDREALAQMTSEVMSALTRLVEDVRDRYPKRWNSDR